MDSGIIDTTVQIKNIKHPHDAYLLGKAREEVVKLANNLGFKLNETYEKKYKKGLINLWKYKDISKSKKRTKTMKHMKILVGRLIRRVERKITEVNMLLAADKEKLIEKNKRIRLAQAKKTIAELENND